MTKPNWVVWVALAALAALFVVASSQTKAQTDGRRLDTEGFERGLRR